MLLKTSITGWPIASEMNINSECFRSQQYAHFDGNKKRISKMTVLTLYFYHPLLQKQKPLATIDCESENQKVFDYFGKGGLKHYKNSKAKLNLTLF